MEARVTVQSQSFRLVERMAEANVHHGQEVRADLVGVRVLAFADGSQVQVRFCEMGPIRIREVIASGDDRPLPADVVVEGLNVGAAGMYDVLNARLSSNGVIRLVVDEQTAIRSVLGAPNLGTPVSL
jgi:hypothetical protein